ncbi:amino acid ABC transporter permease [uncultured Nocardioides sp.]|uniref:amino acid ABC transporter permease n=1 Tax=uncultured Nocardioides sp. TaxID=198441 RepID=UPI00260E4552|nr:amino acid ABC transporter permease [uncultured Nocardioides sp.]
MSRGTSVLFDVPGPRTRLRHRIYDVAALVLLVVGLVGLYFFLDAKGQLTYEDWEPFVTPEFMVALGEGWITTIQMALTAVLLALVFGVVLGVGKLSDHRWVRLPSALVVEFFRAVPLLLLIVFIFLTYGVGGGIGSYWSVVIGLMLYNGSVLAEIFRAGINALPPGQAEAAYAVGMRKTQVMTTILLPQAVKIMIPAIISQCVVALKDTSLGFYVLAPGLTAVGRSIYTEFRNQFQTVLVLALMYIVTNFILTLIATWVQKRYVGERDQLQVGAAGLSDQDTGLADAGTRHGQV